jgi:hypothetical protein
MDDAPVSPRRVKAAAASFAIVAGLFGLVAYLGPLRPALAVWTVVLLANWPYTIFMIKPINGRLVDTSPEAARWQRVA